MGSDLLSDSCRPGGQGHGLLHGPGVHVAISALITWKEPVVWTFDPSIVAEFFQIYLSQHHHPFSPPLPAPTSPNVSEVQ
jgi:hypothetical protein